LPEIYNDYNSFTPQNLMVQYVAGGYDQHPLKKTPFVPSSAEWAMLANETHDIEPSNLLRHSVLHEEAWIKTT
jgi:hypothetical protein